MLNPTLNRSPNGRPPSPVSSTSESTMSPFESELTKIVTEYSKAIDRSKHDDASDVLNLFAVSSLQTRCVAAIDRAAGRSSVYFAKVSRPRDRIENEWMYLATQVGVAQSLLHDIQAGYMKSLEELIHGAVFGDFLEMAEYLVASGYKDAAAVIAGSTVEAHLRQLCVKSSVPTDVNGKPKKADALNAELALCGAYSKLDQKNVTAWLGLRNDAAHGNYGAYDEQRVRILVDGVRHFITIHPA